MSLNEEVARGQNGPDIVDVNDKGVLKFVVHNCEAGLLAKGKVLQYQNNKSNNINVNITLSPCFLMTMGIWCYF